MLQLLIHVDIRWCTRERWTVHTWLEDRGAVHSAGHMPELSIERPRKDGHCHCQGTLASPEHRPPQMKWQLWQSELLIFAHGCSHLFNALHFSGWGTADWECRQVRVATSAALLEVSVLSIASWEQETRNNQGTWKAWESVGLDFKSQASKWNSM